MHLNGIFENLLLMSAERAERAGLSQLTVSYARDKGATSHVSHWERVIPQ